MAESNWVPFFFESNQFFGTIKDMSDWQRLRDAYPRMTDEELLAGEEATYKGTRCEEERKKHPKYGFRIECDGEPLSAFFERNNMKLETISEKS